MIDQNLLTAQELQDMVRHWLYTPPNGFLGSGYGSDIQALLQSPQRSGLADDLIAKMEKDIPLIGALPPGSVNIYTEEIGNDKMRLLIEVVGELITFDI